MGIAPRARQHIFQLDPHQRVFGLLQDAVIALGIPAPVLGSAPGAGSASAANRRPPSVASGAYGRREAVAHTNSSWVNATCTLTARSFCWGGWLKAHCGLATLISQCAIRPRLSSSSKGCQGFSTGVFVNQRVMPPGPESRPSHGRTTTAWSRLAWKSRRLCWRPSSGVPHWSLVVSPVISRPQSPAVDGHLDRMHMAARILDPDWAGHLATPSRHSQLGSACMRSTSRVSSL